MRRSHGAAFCFLTLVIFSTNSSSAVIYDRVPDLNATAETMQWQVYDRVPALPADENPNSEVGYSQPPSNSAYPQPTGNQVPFNETEKGLYAKNINVMALRSLSPQLVDDLTVFASYANPKTGVNRIGSLLQEAAGRGLVSVPDTLLRECLRSMLVTPAGQHRSPGDPLPEVKYPAVIEDVARYLQTNHEKAHIRAQVLDNTTIAAATDIRIIGKTRLIAVKEASEAAERSLKMPGQLAITDDLNKKLTTLQATLGLKRQPTRDEARGLGFWQKYFQGRENQLTGDLAVGGYLDTPEVRISADLLRTGGKNAPQLLNEPTKLDFAPQEVRGTTSHDWRNDVKVLRLESASQRPDIDDPDHDRKANENGNGPNGRLKLAEPTAN